MFEANRNRIISRCHWNNTKPVSVSVSVSWTHNSILMRLNVIAHATCVWQPQLILFCCLYSSFPVSFLLLCMQNADSTLLPLLGLVSCSLTSFASFTTHLNFVWSRWFINTLSLFCVAEKVRYFDSVHRYNLQILKYQLQPLFGIRFLAIATAAAAVVVVVSKPLDLKRKNVWYPNKNQRS